MANLTEKQTWETGIYQLETTDPVEGGAEGKSNQQAKQLANRTAWLKKQVGDFQNLPTGAIIIWPGETPPDGFLECDGSVLSRTTYAALYAVLGTKYGTGTGATANTTFRLIDYRGEFIRGWDHGRGVDNGRQIGSHQLDAMQKISGHIYNINSRTTCDGAFNKKNSSAETFSGTMSANTFHLELDSARVTRVATETRPRNRAMMFAIKY